MFSLISDLSQDVGRTHRADCIHLPPSTGLVPFLLTMYPKATHYSWVPVDSWNKSRERPQPHLVRNLPSSHCALGRWKGPWRVVSLRWVLLLCVIALILITCGFISCIL